MKQEEVRRSIKNFSDYEVSNLGRVKSCKFHWKDPRILVELINWKGYHKVTLSRQGKTFSFSIHRLVLEAFTGPCPAGCEANHKDTVKTHNEHDNLEWITSGENHMHAHRLGLMVPPKTKLRSRDVLEVRRLAKQGIKQGLIAEMFKISQGNVSNIVCRRIWNYI